MRIFISPMKMRDNTSNTFLYNQGSELNTDAGWYEMQYRGYDPALGRMLQADPLADNFGGLSPYTYGFNDPVHWNDPDGRRPGEWYPYTDGYEGGSTIGGGRGHNFYNNPDNLQQSLGAYAMSMGGDGEGGVEEHKDYMEEAISRYVSLNKSVVWDPYGGGEITREEWIRRGGDPKELDENKIYKFYKGAWVQQTGGDPRTAIVQESGGKIYILANGLTSTFGLGTGITAEQIRKGIVFATEEGATGVKVLSRSLAYAGVGITLAQIAAKNGPISLSDGARLVNATIYTAVGFVPGIGPVLSFGLTTADALGAFEGYYKAVDSMTGIDPTIAWKTGDPRVMNPILKVSYSLTGN